MRASVRVCKRVQSSLSDEVERPSLLSGPCQVGSNYVILRRELSELLTGPLRLKWVFSSVWRF